MEDIKSTDCKVACWGFFGMRNLGDDLLLCELLQKIYTINSNAKIIISGSKEECERFNVRENIESYVGRNPIRFLLASMTADVTLCGPGGLFPHRNTVKLIFWYVLSIISKIRGNQIAFLGVGIGEKCLESSLDKWLWNEIIKRSSFFITRQAGIRKTLGVEGSHVQEGADVVFAMRDLPFCGQKIDSNMVVIALADIFDDRILEKQMFLSQMKIVVEYILAKGYHVQLLTFNDCDDTYLNKELMDHLTDKKNIYVIQYPDNPRSILNHFANASLCIAMRFHAQVLSALCGVPTCTIAYSNKMDDVAEKLGIDTYLTRICIDKSMYYEEIMEVSAEEIISNFVKLEQNKEFVRETIEKNMEELQTMGNYSWEVLSQLLKQ